MAPRRHLSPVVCGSRPLLHKACCSVACVSGGTKWFGWRAVRGTVFVSCSHLTRADKTCPSHQEFPGELSATINGALEAALKTVSQTEGIPPQDSLCTRDYSLTCPQGQREEHVKVTAPTAVVICVCFMGTGWADKGDGHLCLACAPRVCFWRSGWLSNIVSVRTQAPPHYVGGTAARWNIGWMSGVGGGLCGALVAGTCSDEVEFGPRPAFVQNANLDPPSAVAHPGSLSPTAKSAQAAACETTFPCLGQCHIVGFGCSTMIATLVFISVQATHHRISQKLVLQDGCWTST